MADTLIQKAPVTLTERAEARVRTLLDTEAAAHPETAPVALWVGLKTKGCSGYSYDMKFLTQGDIDAFANLGRFEQPERVAQNGVTVFIDGKASLYLTGTIMDWIEDGLSARFDFINPNEKGRCGCGESFHV